MRGRSYTPSPPRGGYGRRGRSPSPRGRYASRDRDLPTSLLVRNLRHDCRQDDLRRPFAQFGPVKDIYLPRDYHTGNPRGFGFVQFVDPADAAEAKYQMDGQILQGRQLTVVFAEENRKKPSDMRARERPRGRVNDRRRSPPRYSRSPPPRYGRSRSRSAEYYSPAPKRTRQYSRSVSPQEKKHRQERSYSRSPALNGSRSRSPPARNGSPPYRNGSRSRSPVRDRSPLRGQSRSPPPIRRGGGGGSRSPDPAVAYSKGADREESPSQ